MTNINLTLGNGTITWSDPCQAAFGDYTNAYNLGKAAALSQISHLLILIVVGILIAAFAPKFSKYCKTENQKKAVEMAYEIGLVMALAAALFTFGLHWVTMVAPL